MTDKRFNEKMTDHPLIWIIGMLVTGYVTGVASMRFLEDSQGMKMITMGEYQKTKQLIIDLKKKVKVLQIGSRKPVDNHEPNLVLLNSDTCLKKKTNKLNRTGGMITFQEKH
ncbi:MAG: hypothetical protein JKY19_10145 [Alcanivoracaceae bacterium]|nr:hypothetical protein [Alcanivoracaceae bacterium]